MTRVIISLGSNIEPREERLAMAREALAALPQTELVRASSVIETEGVDVPSEFASLKFLNQVVILMTALEMHDFSQRIHAIEDLQGRVRTGVRNIPRTIDIDIIDFGGVVNDEPELQLPHPRAKERAFVMQPLTELGITL